MEFDSGERGYLNEMRMLSTDNEGNEIFVGLSVAESKEYFELTRLERRSDGNAEATDRYMALHDKHERARMAVLGAEASARQDTSRRH